MLKGARLLGHIARSAIPARFSVRQARAVFTKLDNRFNSYDGCCFSIRLLGAGYNSTLP